ncbi:alpha/beta fold hydrolase [Sandarakinorhabdus sp. DWP1-3-1]|uniref:alpha/beta hydrolase n=1 Tax=Sandarakinorhabdus sp. DWP1-3-1 TaxID=2804627 RepID=UPI003CEDAC2C
MVAVPGGALPVETIGHGPPLLLLHGWTFDRRMWGPQLPLADCATLVAIDRRGFGDATAPADLAAEPDDVLRVADALGIGRFHLIGMSQGGRVALALAARAARTSGRLLSLTLQGTALDGASGDDEAVPLAAMADAARADDLAGLRGLWGAHPLMRAVTPDGAALAAAMLADYAGRDLAAPGALAASAAMIAGAGFPVTAIVGAQDTARRRANVAALAAAGARAVVLPGAGHLCNIDAAEGFNAVLRGVLSGGLPRSD